MSARRRPARRPSRRQAQGGQWGLWLLVTVLVLIVIAKSRGQA